MSHLGARVPPINTPCVTMYTQDKCRVSGAKEQRQIFVFEKALLVTKQKPDGMLVVKAFISVRNCQETFTPVMYVTYRLRR